MADEPATATSYDEIPYHSRPFPQSHPGRLATVAALFGLTPPPIDRCRVLELGCAAGGNLIPMADALPESAFLGIDYSARQVADGRTVIETAGLANVEIRHLSITDVDQDLGTFDYVICHGVFSWVASDVQEKILRICREQLSPDGIAYVSYNTYPGWRMRGMIRDMMLFHASRFRENTQRIQQARAVLRFLSESAASDTDAYAILLKSELEFLGKQPDSYLFHDHLEAVNEPLYFYQFVRRAAAHQLVYVGEAEPATMWSGNFDEKVQQTLSGIESDVVLTEQYMDFIRNRMFRQTLLCHAGKAIERRLRAEHLTRFHVASGLAATEPPERLNDPVAVTFKSGRGTVTTSLPLLKAAMLELQGRWPQAIRIDELAGLASERLARESGPPTAGGAPLLGEHLGRFYLKNLVEFSLSPSDFVVTVSDRPRTSRLARHQAHAGTLVTNRRHEATTVDEFCRQMLQRLDGSHDHDALGEAILKAAAEGRIRIHRPDGADVPDEAERRRLVAEGVRIGLGSLAHSALLVA